MKFQDNETSIANSSEYDDFDDLYSIGDLDAPYDLVFFDGNYEYEYDGHKWTVNPETI